MSSPAIPSNAQLRAKILAILDKDKDDLSVLSVKKVRQQLETDFGFECDGLLSLKDAIKEIVTSEVARMNEAAERVEAEPAEDKSQDRKKRMMEAAKGATTQPEKKAKAAPKPKKEEPKKVKESKKEKAKPKPKAKPKKKKRYSDEEDEESDVGSGSDSDDSRKKSRKPRSGKVSLREELADLGGDGDADVSTARRPPRRAAAAAAAKGFKEATFSGSDDEEDQSDGADGAESESASAASDSQSGSD